MSHIEGGKMTIRGKSLTDSSEEGGFRDDMMVDRLKNTFLWSRFLGFIITWWVEPFSVDIEVTCFSNTTSKID